METLHYRPSESDIVKTVFPTDGRPLMVQHTPEADPVSAPLFWAKQGCPREIINKIIKPDGTWGIVVDDVINPYEMRPRVLMSTLTEPLKPVYIGNTYSLHGARKYFNEHDLRHHMWVGSQGIKFLEEGGYDKKIQLVAAAAAAVHDTGNIVSREAQARVSCEILKITFPNLKFTQEDMDEVLWTILHHDEPSVTRLLGGGPLRFDDIPEVHGERLERMKNIKKPAWWAVAGADKKDITRRRVSPLAEDIRAMESSPHTETYALFDTDTRQLRRKGDVFNWNMHFKPDLSPAEFEDNIAYTMGIRGESGLPKVYVPQDTHDRYLIEGIPHFYSTLEKLTQIHEGRFIISAYTQLALHDDLKQVNISFHDGGQKIFKIVAERIQRGIVFRKSELAYTSHPHHPSNKPPKLLFLK